MAYHLRLLTDRRAEFESDLWQQLMKFLGTHRIRTTAYYPAANGLVERFHRQLKAALSTGQSTQWIESATSSPPWDLLLFEGRFTRIYFRVGLRYYATSTRTVFCAIPRQGGYRSCFLCFTSTHAHAASSPYTYITSCSHQATCQLYIEHVHPRVCSPRCIAESPPTHLRWSIQGHLVFASKCFTVLVHGQEQTISLDRLKAAHLNIAEDVLPASTSTPSSTATSASSTATPASTSATPQVPVHTTHSGRHVHLPERYTYYRSLAAHWGGGGSTVVYKH